jgi:TolB-like protein
MGETQASLAGLLGVDRSTVGEWERGETQPSPQSMRGLIREGILTRADAGRLIRFPDEAPLPKSQETHPTHNGNGEVRGPNQAHSIPASTEKLNVQNVQAPDFDGRPAIAVLAFENNSNDETQDYFADGITEDVMDGLGRWRWFPIIAGAARGGGGSPDFRQLGQELGARYLLKGSVRRVGGRMRLSVSLIDANSRIRMWGEQFDRDVSDIFEVQDDITRQIVSHCAPQIMMAESEKAAQVRPHSVNAWDSLARGLWFHHRARDGPTLSPAIGLARCNAYVGFRPELVARSGAKSFHGSGCGIARRRARQ